MQILDLPSEEEIRLLRIAASFRRNILCFESSPATIRHTDKEKHDAKVGNVYNTIKQHLHRNGLDLEQPTDLKHLHVYAIDNRDRDRKELPAGELMRLDSRSAARAKSFTTNITEFLQEVGRYEDALPPTIRDTIIIPWRTGEAFVHLPPMRPFNDPPFKQSADLWHFWSALFHGLFYLHRFMGITYGTKMTPETIMYGPRIPANAQLLDYSRDLDLWKQHPHLCRSRPEVNYFFADVRNFRIHGEDARDRRHLHRFQNCPFANDIFNLGQMIEEELLKKYDGFEFLRVLVQQMTHADPRERPTIEEAIRYLTALKDWWRSARLRCLESADSSTLLPATVPQERTNIKKDDRPPAPRSTPIASSSHQAEDKRRRR